MSASVMLALACSTATAQVHRRGDATCSGTADAADVVASIRGLGGASSCDNDDCDRDGAVTAADVACSAGCLFGTCAVPEHAARVTAVMADSAPDVVPGSAVRIAVANAGPPDANVAVTVGGLEAEVIERGDGELLIALPPDLPPGRAAVVVTIGDLDGPPMSIEIAAPLPVGSQDTFDGTLALVDEVMAKLLALDVDAAFPDDAASVRDGAIGFRAELAAQRAALASDPELTAADRLALDAAIDASGVPEMLRALLVEIDAVSGGDGGPAAPTQPYLAWQNGGRTIKVVAGVAKAAGITISAPIIAAIGAGLAINGGAILAASDPLTPLIYSATYTDARGEKRAFPTAGGFITLTGAHFDARLTNLDIRWNGAWNGRDAVNNADGSVTYRLPDETGICGKVIFTLSHSAGRYTSNPVETRFQPELTGLERTSGRPGEEFIANVRSTADCADGVAVFTGASEHRASLFARGVHDAHVRVPQALPGTYTLSLQVRGVRSLPAEDQPFNVANPLTGLKLTCPGELHLPPIDDVISNTCQVLLLPADALRPQPSRYVWTSNRPARVSVPATTESAEALLTPRDAGTAKIKVALESTAGPRAVLATSNEVEVRVVDRLPPQVSISSTATSPVQPGASIPVAVTVTDNVKIGPVQLSTTGDAVSNGATQESIECFDKKSCTVNFTVTLKERDFTQTTVTIQARAFDVAGESSSSSVLTFSIAKDTTCPTLTIQSPASGGNVNAGETVTVMAAARDDGPTDTGVKRFVYSATGASLTAPVMQSLPLPVAQQSPMLNFNFTVKNAAELTDVEDRTITISVEAFDDAMPPNSCGPQTVSVGVLGVLDRCQGGVTVDRSAGYIGESFTITVVLAGEGADEVTRVISRNPGGEFPLQSQGGGAYTVTLFYQGTGRFTLLFIALDAAGDERCSGSIALESLGPRPEGAAAAATAGAELPAGGSR